MVYTVFGLFLIPISTEFGWPRSAVSIVLLIIAIAGALAYPIVGRMIDRFGARAVILPGNLLFAAAVATVSLVSASYFQFYAAYALIGVTAAIPSSVMFTKVIAGWFDRHRGLFLGFVGGVGNGTGAALSPIFVHMLLSNYGWRGAYQGIAAAIVLIGFPILFLFLRDPPGASIADTATADGMTLAEARRTGTFWLILIAIALGAGCVTAVFAHVIPMLVDRGIAIDKAVAVLVTFSMVTAAWQVGVGYMLDRIPRPWIAAPFYVAAVAGLLLLVSTSNQTLLLTAGLLMGLGLGTEYGTLPYFLSRYFGVRHYGAISGMTYGVIVLTQGMTPFLMDLNFDIAGNYDYSVIVISVALLGGAAIITTLRPFDTYGMTRVH